MFDIDAGRSPNLRLGADKPCSAADEMADIERQMEALCARHAELALAIGSKVAQSEPIPVSIRASRIKIVPTERISRELKQGGGIAGPCGGPEGPPGDITLSTDNDFWAHRHRAEATEAQEVKWGADLAEWLLRYKDSPALPAELPGLCTLALRNYVRNHADAARHRVMAGEQAMIARSAGHIDRLTAAVAGEIDDPAAALRRERN